MLGSSAVHSSLVVFPEIAYTSLGQWVSIPGCDSSRSVAATLLWHSDLLSNITFSVGHTESATVSLGCGNIAPSPRAGCASE